jgi:hypothetical protein
MAQRRSWTTVNGERRLVAVGPAYWLKGAAWQFPTRRAANRQIMEMVHNPDWEHRNPYSTHEFYWVKRFPHGRSEVVPNSSFS